MISAMLTIDLPLQCRLSIVGRRVKHLPPKLIAPPSITKLIYRKGGRRIPSGIPTSIDTTVSTLEMHSEGEDDDDDDDHNAIFEASSLCAVRTG